VTSSPEFRGHFAGVMPVPPPSKVMRGKRWNAGTLDSIRRMKQRVQPVALPGGKTEMRGRGREGESLERYNSSIKPGGNVMLRRVTSTQGR